jgi:hypothetical protein
MKTKHTKGMSNSEDEFEVQGKVSVIIFHPYA